MFDGGGVALVGCVRVPSWLVVVVGGFPRRWWLFVAGRVVCALLCRLRIVVSFPCCQVTAALSCHFHIVMSFPRFGCLH